MLSRQLILLFLLLSLAACESLVTDIDPSKLPQVDSKLVVQCFISPQSPRTNVVVTESVPLFGEPDLRGGVVRNAIVKLSDGSREVVVPYDTASALYSIDKSLFPIAASKTYFLTVSDGARSVNASCKVPANEVRPVTYEIDTSYSGDFSNRDTSITLKMNWYDIAQETNYYRVRATLDLEYSAPDGTSPQDFEEKRIRNRFVFDWDDTIGRNDFRNDVNLDGASFTSPIGRVKLPRVISFDFGSGNVFTVYPKSKIVSVIMEVFNTDEPYFRYHRSLQTRGDSDNPFIEPSLIYTNIEGGLGCFGSYNAGQLVYRPK